MSCSIPLQTFHLLPAFLFSIHKYTLMYANVSDSTIAVTWLFRLPTTITSTSHHLATHGRNFRVIRDYFLPTLLYPCLPSAKPCWSWLWNILWSAPVIPFFSIQIATLFIQKHSSLLEERAFPGFSLISWDPFSCCFQRWLYKANVTLQILFSKFD